MCNKLNALSRRLIQENAFMANQNRISGSIITFQDDFDKLKERR